MLQGGTQGSSSGNGNQRFSDALLLEAYHASWMDPSPPRDLPCQRAAAAAAVITVQRQQQVLQQLQISSPAHDDLQDPLTQQLGPVDTSSFSWVSAYRRAGHRRLPRQLRVFGWRLLHAGVKVGARRMVAAGRAEPAQFVCQAQPCQAQQQQQQLETLSHLFLQCPVAAAVWQWFATVWQQVQPGAAVPVSSSRVLLLDDSSEWAPPQDKEQLWTYMRLLLLESIWAVRSSCQGSILTGSSSGSSSGDSAGSQGEGSGRSSSSAYTAKAIACRFKAELQEQLRRDWMRVGADVRLGSGVPMAWLKGPPPTIGMAQFWFRWGPLFTVGDGGEVAVAISTAGL
jgi:hypothetical protein